VPGEVPTHVTYICIAILVAMIAALALEEKIHAKKSMITGFFAMVSLLVGAIFGILPFDAALVLPGGHEVHLPIYIPAVDWEVIAIIFGASLFIDVVSRSGIFTWTAIRLTKLSAGDPRKLLWYYAGLTVVFSALLNNVTAMIIVGSLTVVSLGKLERKDLLLGFLLAEGLLTNVGGLLTLISSVPNIILGNMAGISFVKFVLVAAPYVLFSTVMTVVMAVKIFGIQSFARDAERAAGRELVASFDENDGIESRSFFKLSWALLAAFILTIATTTWIPYIKELGMGYVAVSFAIIALIRYKHEVDKNFAAVDWDLLAFFTFLFVVINVMEHALVLDLIGDGIGAMLGLGEAPGAAALLWSSSLASSVTDNVPLAAVMGKILQAQADTPDLLWWSTIFGTNLGGNFTPIGSASTVVAVAVIHKHGLRISFGRFVVKAAPFAIAQLLLATGYVLLFLR
jgi:Na+/H+ antiporter NhaD/arsenite permease-like protein